MEQRRFSVFLMLSLLIGVGWFNFAVPILFPGLMPKPKPFKKPAQVTDELVDAAPVDALFPANVAAEPVANADKVLPPVIPEFPEKTVQLGPTDPDKDKNAPLKEELDEFFIAASLTSKGAAVDYAELTDKARYPAFGHRNDRIRVLGSDPTTKMKTFSLQIPEIDRQLGLSSLDQTNWEVVPEPDPKTANRAATFRLTSPDGKWEITKHFEIKQLTLEELEKPEIKRTLVDGYEIKLKITIRNRTNQASELDYTLLGPVGVPLEDVENSYKYRDVRMGFLRVDGKSFDESKLSAADVVKKAANNKTEVWTRKIKYIGVDVLYFAALIIPGVDAIETTKAVVISPGVPKPDFSDVSVQIISPTLKVPGNGEVSHEYSLFAGPKRKELISQLSAMAVMDYGWFDTICRGMVWLLNMFHSLGLSYGVAIICLTVLVRTLLMPISKHQAANAAKMKVLQPKMMEKQKELEARYGKNTEEYMKGAQELSKEQLGLMMSGCLPVFLQLPIFIALYRAIGSSIELRMEPFLWFENLAAPDALFALPFVVPWFGWKVFNLLPCISTGLMFIHQKLTMPPPTNEEQAQQQKMMGFMMIFMGAMFYRVPSGLCLYFIATNIWSMTERWLFEHLKKTPPPEAEAAFVSIVPAPTGPTPENGQKPSALGGFWNRLQEAADAHQKATRKLENATPPRDDKKKKKR